MARYKNNPVKRRFVSLYKNLMRRCYPTVVNGKRDFSNPKNGGIADIWLQSKSNFITWSIEQDPPDEGYYLARIDLDKPYSPDNCHFILLEEKYKNLPNNRWLEYKGKRLILADLIKQYSVVSRAAFLDRLHRGFTIEGALTKPSRKTHKKTSKVSKLSKNIRTMSRKDEAIYIQQVRDFALTLKKEVKVFHSKYIRWKFIVHKAQAACM